MEKATENKTENDWTRWCRNYVETSKNKLGKLRKLTSDESLALRDAVIRYESVAKIFFTRMITGIIDKYKCFLCSTIDRGIKSEDVACCIYNAFYEEGKWTRLNSFRGDCTIFHWVNELTRQFIYGDFRERWAIEPSHEKNLRNTSLTLRSIRDKDELKAIIGIVRERAHYKFLYLRYVKGLGDQEMMDILKLERKEFCALRRRSERDLQARLIEVEFIPWKRDGGLAECRKPQIVNLVSLALGDVSGSISTVSSDKAGGALANMVDADNSAYSHIEDSLPLQYLGLPYGEQWRRFICDQIYFSDITAQQLKVWILRFIREKSPDDTAKILHIRRSAVDTAFMRANKGLFVRLRTMCRKAS